MFGLDFAKMADLIPKLENVGSELKGLFDGIIAEQARQSQMIEENRATLAQIQTAIEEMKNGN